MNTEGSNPRYLPGVRLEPGIAATCELSTALESSDLVLTAVPAQQLRAVAGQMNGYVFLAAIFAEQVAPYHWQEGEFTGLPEPPLVPGLELSGIVEAVGDGVTGLSPGAVASRIHLVKALLADKFIADHSAVKGIQVAYAVLSAIAST